MSLFANFPPDLLSNWEVQGSLKLLFSTILGSMIGWERSRKHKPVGARTCSIITVSATLFTLLSIHGFDAFGSGPRDPARLAAQVLTGIGFIGAGVILREERLSVVRGITTAASVWALTAVGMAIATDSYIVGTVMTFILIFALNMPKRKGTYHPPAEVVEEKAAKKKA
jgi:putative Mg2+ transporter-C (MgtC) family protein